MTPAGANSGGKRSKSAAESAEPVDDGIAVGVPDAGGLGSIADELEAELDGDRTATDDAGIDASTPSAERDEYLGALQRLQADFENYRKRVQRQQDEQAVRAARDLVGKILPVLDTLDLALAHVGEGTDAGSLEHARVQLLDVLVKEGLERVDGVGVSFDPEVHDAVAHAPVDDADSDADSDDKGDEDGGVRVEEVLRAGYRWRGTVLRPAMVRVRG